MGPDAERILSDGIAGLRPPPGAKQRGWRTLRRQVDDAPRRSARPAWVVPIVAAIGLAAALVLLWALASTRTVVADRSDLDQALDRAAPTDREHTASAPEPTPTPPSAAAPASISPPTSTPTVVVPPAPRRASPSLTLPTQPPAQDDSLERAATIVQAGQRALASGRADLALSHARAHQREFPSGALAEDAGLLEIAALCRLARTDEAASATAALRERFPDSSLVRTRADAPCGE